MINIEEQRVTLSKIGEEMLNLCQSQVEQSFEAFITFDTDIAEEVILKENRINALDLKIERDCEKFIALYNPVAIDLRFTMAVLKINFDLERIGDEAKKIANHAILLSEDINLSKGYPEIRHIGTSVIKMLANALDAFARFDADAAIRTIEEDKQIDQEYKTALRELATYMMEDPRSISRVMNVLWVVRSLERIGDHAKNLCEQIVFVVKGKDIRHQK